MNATEVHRDVGKSLLLSAPASHSIESEQRERDKNKISNLITTKQTGQQVVMTGLGVPRVSPLYIELFIIHYFWKHENIYQKSGSQEKYLLYTQQLDCQAGDKDKIPELMTIDAIFSSLISGTNQTSELIS